MPTLKQRPKNKFKRILLIGHSGGGKSTLLGTFPNPYICDFDNGLDVLGERDDITYDEFYDVSAWGRLVATTKMWRNKPQGETFCIDSFTTACDRLIEHTLKKNAHDRMSQPDWGDAISEVKQLLGYLSVLPCHVVITTHYQLHKDETSGEILYTPNVFGKKLPDILTAYFNDVWRPFVEAPLDPAAEPTYNMQVKPAGRYNTLKTTFKQIKGIYAPPSFAELMAQDAS